LRRRRLQRLRRLRRLRRRRLLSVYWRHPDLRLRTGLRDLSGQSLRRAGKMARRCHHVD
jgi:hypothetical protein